MSLSRLTFALRLALFVAIALFNNLNLRSQELFFDSFSRWPNEDWKTQDTWGAKTPPLYNLSSPGEGKSVSARLAKNLPADFKLQIHVLPPKVWGEWGFQFLDKAEKPLYRLCMDNQNQPLAKQGEQSKGAGFELSLPNQEIQFSATEKLRLSERHWLVLDVIYESGRLSLSADNEELWSSTGLAHPNQLSLWAKGDGKVSFDECRLISLGTLASDFVKAESAFSPALSGSWLKESGLWSLSDRPSLGGECLMEWSKDQGRRQIKLQKEIPSVFELAFSLELDHSQGKAGWFLNTQDGKHFLLSLSTVHPKLSLVDIDEEKILAQSENKDESYLLPSRAHRLHLLNDGTSLRIEIDGDLALETPFVQKGPFSGGFWVEGSGPFFFSKFSLSRLIKKRGERVSSFSDLSFKTLSAGSQIVKEPTIEVVSDGSLAKASLNESLKRDQALNLHLELLKPFELFSMNLVGTISKIQLQLLYFDDVPNLVVLHLDTPKNGIPGSGPRDRFSKLYRDDYNMELNELLREPLAKDINTLDLNILLEYDKQRFRPQLIIKLGDKELISTSAAEDDQLWIEMALRGKVRFHSLDFTTFGGWKKGKKNKVTKAEYRALQGTWLSKGGHFDDSSLAEKAFFRWQDQAAENCDMSWKLSKELSKGQQALELGDNKELAIITDLSDETGPKIELRPKEGKSEQIALTPSSGNTWNFSLTRSGAELSLFSQGALCLKKNVLPSRGALSLSFRRIKGPFSLEEAQLQQYPVWASEFSSYETFLSDLYRWETKSLPVLASRESNLFAPSFVAMLADGGTGSVMRLTIKKALSTAWALAFVLDLEEAKASSEVRYRFELGEKEGHLNFVNIDKKWMAVLLINDKKVAEAELPSASFQARLFVSDGVFSFLIDGKKLIESPFKGESTDSYLKVEFVTPDTQSHIFSGRYRLFNL